MIESVEIHPHQVRHGDVVALGRRFYAIETETPRVRCGYALLMLRSLHDGARGVYEFRPDCPEWVTALVFAAHDDGEFLPDDWRYEVIRNAVDAIAESQETEDLLHEFADGEVDAYTLARFAWLGSHIRRQFYVDDAVSEFGASEGVADAVGLGQYMEASEVFGSVLASLESRVEAFEVA